MFGITESTKSVLFKFQFFFWGGGVFFTVVWHMNVPTHGNGGSTVHCCVGMYQLTIIVVPQFTVLLDLNVPTHNNGRAIAQCCVPDGCNCNNGNTEIHT